MAPTLILIRHAQALHNVSHKLRNYTLPDPKLTDLGFGPQCEELARHLENDLPLAQEIELIVVSPMNRTLQTAQQSLGWLMKRGVPVILRAEWQENSHSPCDTGTSIDEMEKEWPQFDWSTVDPLYPSKTGLYDFSKSSLINRGITAKEWLKNRPEKVIAVVSHSAFLRIAVSQRYYENADFRIFNFTDGDDKSGVKLVEWELTEAKGGGLGKSPKEIFVDEEESANVPETAVGEVAIELPN